MKIKRAMEILKRRKEFLDQRTSGSKCLSFDEAESAAIYRVLKFIREVLEKGGKEDE